MDDKTFFENERERLRCDADRQIKLMAETLDRIERVYREANERDAAREHAFWKRLEKVQADKLDVIRLRGENQRDMLTTLVPVVLPVLTEYLKQKAEPVDTNYVAQEAASILLNDPRVLAVFEKLGIDPGDIPDEPEPPGPTAPVEPPQAGEAPSSTEPPFGEA